MLSMKVSSSPCSSHETELHKAASQQQHVIVCIWELLGVCTCKSAWLLHSQNVFHSVWMVSCRCYCGAAKCQGYLEADSAQNRAALLIEADSGLDDALVSFMLASLADSACLQL